VGEGECKESELDRMKRTMMEMQAQKEEMASEVRKLRSELQTSSPTSPTSSTKESGAVDSLKRYTEKVQKLIEHIGSNKTVVEGDRNRIKKCILKTLGRIEQEVRLRKDTLLNDLNDRFNHHIESIDAQDRLLNTIYTKLTEAHNQCNQSPAQITEIVSRALSLALPRPIMKCHLQFIAPQDDIILSIVNFGEVSASVTEDPESSTDSEVDEHMAQFMEAFRKFKPNSTMPQPRRKALQSPMKAEVIEVGSSSSSSHRNDRNRLHRVKSNGYKHTDSDLSRKSSKRSSKRASPRSRRYLP